MPELPEVETIRQDLRLKILNNKITTVEVLKQTATRGTSYKFSESLVGNYFEEIDRIGKLLIFKLKKPALFLLIHLKMTGQLIYTKGDTIVAGGHGFPLLTKEGAGVVAKRSTTRQTPPNLPIGSLPDKHTQLIINFSDGGNLYFNDLRRFGYARIMSEDEKNKIVSAYGLEPLSDRFTLGAFSALLGSRKTILKAFLLDQTVIAGIGNIYADEACHCAGVLPWRKVNSLKSEEIKKLYNCIPEVLKRAIKYRGTTFNNYVDSEGNKGNFVRFLKVYDRDGKNCLTCQSIILKKKIAGRGTHYCPVCQK